MVATCISSLRGGNSPSSDATTILLSTAKNASEKTKQRQQTEMLDMWIARHGDNLYPCREEKERIAKELCMSYLQVNRWFANRRRKETKRRKEEASSSPRPTSSLNGRITADDTTATTTWSTREIATETAEQNPAEDAMVINAVVPDSSSIVSGAGNLMKADINQDNTIIPQVATAFQQVPELHRPIMSMSPSLIQDRQRIAAAAAAAAQQQQQQQVSMENGINKILTQVAAVPTPPPPVPAPQPTSLTAALSNAAAFAFSSAAAQSVNPYLLAAACSMQQNLANSLGLPTNNAPSAPQLPWNNNCVQSINAVLPYLQQLHAQAQQVALAQQLFAAQQQAAAAANANANGNGNGLVTSSPLTTTTNLSPQTQLISNNINNNNNGPTPPQHWLSPPPSATASIPDNVSSPFLLNGDESYSSLSEISELSPQPRGDIISPFTKETPSLISDEDLMIDSLIEERRDLSEKESIAVAVLAGMAACQR